MSLAPLIRTILIVALLCAPGVATAASESWSAELFVKTAPRVDGLVRLTATHHAALDLANTSTFQLEWGRGTGVQIERLRQERGPDGARAWATQEISRESFDLEPGHVLGFSCRGECVVLAYAKRDAASFVGNGTVSGRLMSWDPETTQYETSAPDGFDAFIAGSRGDSAAYGTDFNWLTAHTDPAQDGFAMEDAEWAAEGEMAILLWNATLDVQLPQARRGFRSGMEPSHEPVIPGDLGTSERAVVVVLYLAGARLHVPRDEPVRLHASSWTAEVDGTLTMTGASGVVNATNGSRSVTNAQMRVHGAFAFHAGYPMAYLANDPQGSLDTQDRGFRVRFDDTTASRAEGHAALTVPVSEEPTSFTRAAIGAALLVALLFGLFAPLYSRLDARRVLSNANRARLHALLCEEPGQHPSELSRRIGRARVVVQYHLGVLERHGLVRVVLVGRARRYFPLAAEAQNARRLVDIHLQTPARRGIAEALALADAALTQRELAERTGFAQTVVSYHLARLARVGLVKAEGPLPRRYVAAEQLRRALMDEDGGGTGAGGGNGSGGGAPGGA